MSTPEFALRLVLAFVACGVGGFIIGWYLYDIHTWLERKLRVHIPLPVSVVARIVIAYVWANLVWKVAGLQSKIFFLVISRPSNCTLLV